MNKSETLSKLGASLAIAQSNIKTAKKDSTNPFFKSRYADLQSIIEAVKEPLNSVGISILQIVQEESVETVLLHASGEWLSGNTPLVIPKEFKKDRDGNIIPESGFITPQALGSAITYAKRYGLQAMLGLPTEDDDGEAAMGRSTTKKTSVVQKQPLNTTSIIENTNSNGFPF